MVLKGMNTSYLYKQADAVFEISSFEFICLHSQSQYQSTFSEIKDNLQGIY